MVPGRGQVSEALGTLRAVDAFSLLASDATGTGTPLIVSDANAAAFVNDCRGAGEET
jgi:hypothetical protein